MTSARIVTAFVGDAQLAAGALAEVAQAVGAAHAAGEHRPILVFEDETGRQVDLDLRPGTSAAAGCGVDAGSGLPPQSGGPGRGPGRPKLGVVPREVTLLPRHWEWLAAQPGGASVTLRRLVDAARKIGSEAADVRRAQEAADRFMSAMLGNAAGYEEAARALYAGDRERFDARIAPWPTDLRAYLARLAAAAFAPALQP